MNQEDLFQHSFQPPEVYFSRKSQQKVAPPTPHPFAPTVGISKTPKIFTSVNPIISRGNFLYDSVPWHRMVGLVWNRKKLRVNAEVSVTNMYRKFQQEAAGLYCVKGSEDLPSVWKKSKSAKQVGM